MAAKTPTDSASPLVVHLDEPGMAILTEAAKLRRLSLGDYGRTVAVAQASREVEAARRSAEHRK